MSCVFVIPHSIFCQYHIKKMIRSFLSVMFLTLIINNNILFASETNECVAIGKYIAGGFKNMVFHSTNSGDDNVIIRAGFVSNGSKVLNFRKTEDVDYFKAAVRKWEQQKNGECEYSRILSKMVQFEKTVSARDIVPLKDLKKEYFFQAQSSTVSKCFGSSSTIERTILPLPTSNISMDSISLVVEYHVRLSGNIVGVVKNMTEDGLISLIYCYFADQLSFKSQLGKFHVNGHSGNLLYTTRSNGKFSFVWSDFGKTSATSNNMGAQFQNSLVSIHNCIIEAAALSNYSRLTQLLKKLSTNSINYEPNLIMSEGYIQSALSLISAVILEKFNATEVASILEEVAPFSSFGVEHFLSQLNLHTSQISELQIKNSELERSNAMLATSYAEMKTSNAELTRNVTELARSNAEMKSSNAELLTSNAELLTSNAELLTSNAELTRNVTELLRSNAEMKTSNAELTRNVTELARSNAETKTELAEMNFKVIILSKEIFITVTEFDPQFLRLSN